MNLRTLHILIIILILFLLSCNNSHKTKNETKNTISEQLENATNKVVLSSEIKWEKLNPARGNKSPEAGTIWGDRNGTEATGFLAKFVDGFSSPPHIHNVTYRAIVIKGLIHNDDANAKEMWMEPGSFWTQPAGESHITSSKGKSIALVEIDKGPYLVKPIEEEFDNRERPINVDASNVIWLNSKEINWIDSESNVEISFLWDDNVSKGLFVKLPNKYNGTVLTNGTVLYSVVIQGEMNYILPQNKELKLLDPGSSFSSTAKAIHKISNANNEVILYIKTNGSIKINEL